VSSARWRRRSVEKDLWLYVLNILVGNQRVISTQRKLKIHRPGAQANPADVGVCIRWYQSLANNFFFL
jgi:hypothetical protein